MILAQMYTELCSYLIMQAHHCKLCDKIDIAGGTNVCEYN